MANHLDATDNVIGVFLAFNESLDFLGYLQLNTFTVTKLPMYYMTTKSGAISYGPTGVALIQWPYLLCYYPDHTNPVY